MKKIAILMLLLFSLESIAQSYQENLEKYWYFRHRLKEQFMYFSGDASVQGSHIIAENRNEFVDDPYIRWGDATWVLGHYIGVLALEYKLLEINGQDVLETLDELNWAFDTYYRLDYNAEPCFNNILGNPGNPSTNGFFLRDDVDLACSEYFDDLDIRADYSACQQGGEQNCNSQDQCYLLLFGLKLAKELVDNEDIQDRVYDITKLVIGSMNWYNPLVFQWVWEIRNPVTLGVPPGGQVLELESFCWAAAEAAQSITDDNEHKGYSSNSKPQFDIAQGLVWDMLQGGNPGLDKFVGYYTMILSTILNEGGGYGPGIDGNAYDWLCEIYNLTDAYEGMGSGIGLMPHLAAISEILHGYDGDNHRPASFYEDSFLNDAPVCGSFNDNIKHEDSNPPWHTLSLFSPWHRSAHIGFPGRYNMLDYMMLYNAYFYIYHHDALHVSETSNEIYPFFVELPPPHESYWVYTTEDPKKIEAVKTIITYDQVNEGGGVIYKSGERISLMPGFSAKSGSSVIATVDESMLDLPYYAKTNIDPCDGGTFEPLVVNYVKPNFPVVNAQTQISGGNQQMRRMETNDNSLSGGGVKRF